MPNPTPPRQDFTLAENSPEGTVLGAVNFATQGTIQSGNTGSAFEVVPESGDFILQVLTKSALNFEVTPQFNMLIDGRPVRVTLTNVTGPALVPTASIELISNTPIGTAVSSVLALGEGTLHYFLVGGGGGDFSITELTGEVKVIGALNVGTYALQWSAQDDEGTTAGGTLEVRVTAAANTAPTVDAGIPDLSPVLSVATPLQIPLDAAQDPDGDTLSYVHTTPHIRGVIANKILANVPVPPTAGSTPQFASGQGNTTGTFLTVDDTTALEATQHPNGGTLLDRVPSGMVFELNNALGGSGIKFATHNGSIGSSGMHVIAIWMRLVSGAAAGVRCEIQSYDVPLTGLDSTWRQFYLVTTATDILPSRVIAVHCPIGSRVRYILPALMELPSLPTEVPLTQGAVASSLLEAPLPSWMSWTPNNRTITVTAPANTANQVFPAAAYAFDTHVDSPPIPFNIKPITAPPDVPVPTMIAFEASASNESDTITSVVVPAGNDRVLIVFAAAEYTTDRQVNSLKFGTQDLTFVGQAIRDDGSVKVKVEAWRLNNPNGTQDVTAVWSATPPSRSLQAIVFDGCKQLAPEVIVANGSATSPLQSTITTLTAGDMLVDCIAAGNDGALTPTSGAQTKDAANESSPGGFSVGVSHRLAGAPGPYTMGWTHPVPNRLAQLVLAFLAADVPVVVNSPPTITSSPGSISVTDGESLVYNIQVTDPDPTNIITITAVKPDGSALSGEFVLSHTPSVSPATAILTFNASGVGTRDIEVRASDGTVQVTQSFTYTVSAAGGAQTQPNPAVTFYYDPTAAVNGTGTQASPYNSFDSALSAAIAHGTKKTVGCKRGTVTVRNSQRTITGANITLESYGSGEDHHFAFGYDLSGSGWLPHPTYGAQSVWYKALPSAPNLPLAGLMIDGVHAELAWKPAGRNYSTAPNAFGSLAPTDYRTGVLWADHRTGGAIAQNQGSFKSGDLHAEDVVKVNGTANGQTCMLFCGGYISNGTERHTSHMYIKKVLDINEGTLQFLLDTNQPTWVCDNQTGNTYSFVNGSPYILFGGPAKWLSYPGCPNLMYTFDASLGQFGAVCVKHTGGMNGRKVYLGNVKGGCFRVQATGFTLRRVRVSGSWYQGCQRSTGTPIDQQGSLIRCDSGNLTFDHVRFDGPGNHIDCNSSIDQVDIDDCKFYDFTGQAFRDVGGDDLDIDNCFFNIHWRRTPWRSAWAINTHTRGARYNFRHNFAYLEGGITAVRGGTDAEKTDFLQRGNIWAVGGIQFDYGNDYSRGLQQAPTATTPSPQGTVSEKVNEYNLYVALAQWERKYPTTTFNQGSWMILTDTMYNHGNYRDDWAQGITIRFNQHVDEIGNGRASQHHQTYRHQHTDCLFIRECTGPTSRSGIGNVAIFLQPQDFAVDSLTMRRNLFIGLHQVLGDAIYCYEPITNSNIDMNGHWNYNRGVSLTKFNTSVPANCKNPAGNNVNPVGVLIDRRTRVIQGITVPYYVMKAGTHLTNYKNGIGFTSNFDPGGTFEDEMLLVGPDW